ncbi:unnamed protein product [Diatraea saccharalis]|uniref:Peptidase S1 domain-containing protein n=1 Tax=Diatraea saccharalis TaxID=40085 RepID=A0A9N9WK78_9NEOP|nr:unnamed protein product [Diatraea saccharalis]
MSIIRDLSTCHDDFNLKPADGVLKEHSFPWLGFVQYIHVTTGLPHHSKAPRVVLIHKQFALGTATDMLHLPKNYKLGHVIFGDYEREEEECGLTKHQVKLGVKCPRAYIEMPIIDITPHPEFSRKSCLIWNIKQSSAHRAALTTYKNIYNLWNRRNVEKIQQPNLDDALAIEATRDSIGLTNFLSVVQAESKILLRLGSEGVTHVLCSSGCGVRPGSPIISHSADGTFEVIGLTAGGAACSRRAMRRRLNTEPPLYIDVYPYATWIINVITAFILPRPYSHNFKLVDEAGPTMAVNRGNYLRQRKLQRQGWKARTYMSGNYCFKQNKAQKKTAFFYSEQFEVKADPPAKLNIAMMISAGIECTITCARLQMPNRLSTPVIHGVGGYNITIEFDTEWFPYLFVFGIGLSGKNTTERDFARWIGERKPGFWK